MQDKIDHLVDRDRTILVGVGQSEDGGRHPPIAKDLVEGAWRDRVILANEISDGLQKLHDIYPVLVPIAPT